MKQKKILLIQPPHESRDDKYIPRGSFPIGLGLIARALIDNKFDVKVLDIRINKYNRHEVKEIINKSNYEIFGISALVTQYRYVKFLSKTIKQHNKNAKIILGGRLATQCYKTVLNKTNIDICVIGEGEITIVDLMKNIDNLNKVKGIAYKSKNHKFILTKPRAYIKNLDEINFPAYHLFPMEKYLSNCFVTHHKMRAISIISSRGCPFNCYYCQKEPQFRRERSVSNIISELKFLKNKYNIKGITFFDNLLVFNKRRTIELCKEIKKLNLKWDCSARVDTIDLKILKIMKEAGCIWFELGIESGSNKILKLMNKQTSVELNIKAIEMCKKAKVHSTINFMFGYVGEDENTIKEDIDFFKKINLPCHFFSFATPFPGTQLYEYAKKNKLVNLDEDKYLLKLSKMGTMYWPKEEVMVNLTNFSDTELLKKANYFLIKTKVNFIKNNIFKPHILIKYYFNAYIIDKYYNVKGLVKFIKDHILNILQNYK